MSVEDYRPSDRQVARRYEADARWAALSHGLNQLRTDQLIRILKHLDAGGEMACDSFNYDEDRQLWCPLAVGLDIPSWIEQSGNDPAEMTDKVAKRIILGIGRRWRMDFSLNPLSGTPGRFFRTTRQSDVAVVCRLLIDQRRARGTSVGAGPSFRGASMHLEK